MAKTPVIKILSVLVALAAGTPQADAKRVELRYDVRVRGTRIGSARVSVGRPTKRRGRRLLPVSFSADLKPLGLSAIRIKGGGTSWVRPNFTPVEARWDWHEIMGESTVRARWRGTRLDGRYEQGARSRHIVRTLKAGATDVVSVFPWLVAQTYKPGVVLKTQTYTGNQVYTVTARVEAPESVALPGRTREGWPVRFTAVRPGKTRRFTVWIDTETQAPLRMMFDYKFLGTVDAVLVSDRRRP